MDIQRLSHRAFDFELGVFVLVKLLGEASWLVVVLDYEHHVVGVVGR